MRESHDKAFTLQRGGRTLAGRRTDAPPPRSAVPAGGPALCLEPAETGQSLSSSSQQHQMSHEPLVLCMCVRGCVCVITGVIEDLPEVVIKDLEFPSAEKFVFFFFKGLEVGHYLHLRLDYPKTGRGCFTHP